MPWTFASRLGLGLAIAITVATRLGLGLAEPRALIAADVFQDDAFYYLTIARNVVQGAGLTFDGEHPTNAFHPVYLALLLPIQMWSGADPWLPIRGAALLLCAIAAATTPLVFALARRLAGNGAAWVATGAFAFSPQLATLGVNGLETGPALFMGLLLAWLYLRWIATQPVPAASHAVMFGALGGLAVLTRVDLALWLAALGIDWLRRARADGCLPQALRRVALAATSSLTVWLPWGILSASLTGSWLPTSAAASREIAHHLGWSNLAAGFGGAPGVTFDPNDIPWTWRADVAAKAIYVWLFEQPLFAPLRLGIEYGVWPALSLYTPYRLFLRSPWLGLATLPAIGAALYAVWRRLPHTAHPRTGLGFATGLYSVLLLVAYVFGSPSHWYFSRYFALSIWLTTLCALVPLAHAARRGQTGGALRRGTLISAGIAIVAIQASLFAGFRARTVWAQPAERGFLTSWEALRDHLPAEAHLGAFQAGIYGWFSGRPVRNLDGKVNVDAQRALATRRLHEYVLASDLDYILDQPAITRTLMLRHAPPEVRARFVPIATERRRNGATLYRIQREADAAPED